MKERVIKIEGSVQPQVISCAQSANTLFNFMEYGNYLEQTLSRKALAPRYYIEKIKYLQLEVEGNSYDEVAVLQTCFCDIPLSKLFKNESVDCIGEEFEKLSDKDKESAMAKNTHPDFYGKYAIAFDKNWGINKGLQPIHYMNVDAQITKSIKALFKELYSEDNLPDSVFDDFLNRLAYLKPVQGEMEKAFRDEKNVNRTLIYKKVFQDEQEWRFVPNLEILKKYGLVNVQANQQAICETKTWNDKLMSPFYKDLWLNFEYNDIRYLLVPDDEGRNDLIRIISQLPGDLFEENEDFEKKLLISKIIVLQKIKEDI